MTQNEDPCKQKGASKKGSLLSGVSKNPFPNERREPTGKVDQQLRWPLGLRKSLRVIEPQRDAAGLSFLNTCCIPEPGKTSADSQFFHILGFRLNHKSSSIFFKIKVCHDGKSKIPATERHVDQKTIRMIEDFAGIVSFV